MRIPVSGVYRLLEAAAVAAGIDEFGLLMAERGSLSYLGPVALIVREQATVGAAVEALARYVHMHDEAIRVSIEHQGDVVTLAIFMRGMRPRAPRQATEMALGTLHRIISAFFKSDTRPLEVHLARSLPSNHRFYRRFFGCKIIFNSDFDGILLSARDMERSIPTAHPLLGKRDFLRTVTPALLTDGLRIEGGI
jgi:hypothetical protein